MGKDLPDFNKLLRESVEEFAVVTGKPVERLKTLFFDAACDFSIEQAINRGLKPVGEAIFVNYMPQYEGRGPTIWCSFNQNGLWIFDFLVSNKGLVRVGFNRPKFTLAGLSTNTKRIEIGSRITDGDPRGTVGLYPEDFQKFQKMGDGLVSWTERVIRREEIGRLPLGMFFQ